MKRFIAAVFCLLAMTTQVQAAALIDTEAGTTVSQSSLAAACAQTHPVRITSALSSTFSNISSATNPGGVCNAPIIWQPGGSINPTTKFVLARQSSVPAELFGAVGDNSTDNTVAIQNAINSLGKDGGTITFGSGIFKFSSVSTPDTIKRITFQGSGYYNQVNAFFGDSAWASSTPEYGGTVLKCTATSGNCLKLGSVQGDNLNDLMLVGPGTGSAIGVYSGGSFGYTQGQFWNNVLIANFYQGANFQQVYEGQFNSLVFIGNTSSVYEGPSSNQNTWFNLQMQGFTNYGMLLVNNATNVFYGGLAQNYTGKAFDLGGSTQNISIQNFHFESQAASGNNYAVFTEGNNNKIWLSENHYAGGGGGARNDSIMLTGTTLVVDIKKQHMFVNAKLYYNTIPGPIYDVEVDDSVPLDTSVDVVRVVGDILSGNSGAGVTTILTNVSSGAGQLLHRFQTNATSSAALSLMQTGNAASEWQIGGTYSASNPFGQYKFYVYNPTSGILFLLSGPYDNPNGNITGGPGSIYTGTTGRLWVHDSTTATTGWVEK